MSGNERETKKTGALPKVSSCWRENLDGHPVWSPGSFNRRSKATTRAALLLLLQRCCHPYGAGMTLPTSPRGGQLVHHPCKKRYDSCRGLSYCPPTINNLGPELDLVVKWGTKTDTEEDNRQYEQLNQQLENAVHGRLKNMTQQFERSWPEIWTERRNLLNTGPVTISK